MFFWHSFKQSVNFKVPGMVVMVSAEAEYTDPVINSKEAIPSSHKNVLTIFSPTTAPGDADDTVVVVGQVVGQVQFTPSPDTHRFAQFNQHEQGQNECNFHYSMADYPNAVQESSE